MKAMQELQLHQLHHSITFYAYDIEFVKKIEPDDLSRIYIPECSQVGYGNRECHKTDRPKTCCTCDKPHFQELYIDGWCVGDKYGFLDDDCYVAQLQTGIRVPVPKEIYLAWKAGFTNEPGCSSDEAYVLYKERCERYGY